MIVFPLGMLFVGFSTLEIDCVREETGQAPDCDIREIKLFGLFDRRTKALNVSGVGYLTRDVNTTARVTLASTVILEASNDSVPVSQA